MISNDQVAQEVSDGLLEVHRLLNDMVLLVHDRCPADESVTFRAAIGQVLGDILLNVVNPLYRQHPDIRPAGLIIDDI
jgi:hypothetical protein